VQAPDWECRFLSRTFQQITGRKPASMREDFCGTALLCAEWVKKNGRRAVGVDHDPVVLAWGAEHNLAPLGRRAESVRLLEQDVREPCPGRFDVTVALNFSYFLLRTRRDLRAYFAGVRRSMSSDGIFVADAYGGWQTWRPLSIRRKLRDFTYVWEQARIDPLDHAGENYIHFEFRDGSRLHQAFTYHWRAWTLPEIRELLAESGFSRSSVYWRYPLSSRGWTSSARRRAEATEGGAWVVYVVAER
jgi:cyclopropane fatty-acyl-phospholipid synthase-like methyltransferase